MTAFLGCRQEDPIQSYRVSKEAAPAMPAASSENHSKAIDWDLPPGWVEQAPSSMRIGSFLITGANGQTADVSIIPLSGAAGGDLANINRWRGQISLPPISEAELSRDSQLITPGGRSMRFVDFVSDELLLNHLHKKRLVAAIYTHGESTWFFKMLGEDATVESAKPAFLRFLQSVRLHGQA